MLARLSGWLGSTTVSLLDSLYVPKEVPRGGGVPLAQVEQSPCRVHLAEHYPIPSRDDSVLGLHAILPPGSQLFCYVGLDEPWLREVLGDSTRELLDRLGVSESEPIEHAMIGKALRRAQVALDEKRQSPERTARSSSEWMQLNASGEKGSRWP